VSHQEDRGPGARGLSKAPRRRPGARRATLRVPRFPSASNAVIVAK
jgi:hypothetical protein